MLPLQKSALLTAIVLPFISGMKELSLVVMLVTPGTETLTTQSLRFLDTGSPHLANVTILIIGLAKVPLSGRLFGAENGGVRLSGDAVFPMVR
jgi:iron(III) transport system permease protein